MKDDVLSCELKEFFKQFRLQRAPGENTCRRIERYVLRGNRTLGITPDRRADIVRQLQIEWNGQRVNYIENRTGTVLYIVPVDSSPPNHRPQFEARVRWDKPIDEKGWVKSSAVSLHSLTHLTT